MNTEIVKVLGASEEYGSEISEDEVVLVNNYITQDTTIQFYTDFKTSEGQFRSVVQSDLPGSSRLRVVLSEDQKQIKKIVNLESGVEFPAFEFDSISIENGVLSVKVGQDVFRFLLDTLEKYPFAIINQIVNEISPIQSTWEVWS